MSNRRTKYRQLDISKTLSWILRHGGMKEGLQFRTDGYTQVDELLKHKCMTKYSTTLDDINKITESNNKQRFKLELDEVGVLWIKATQGHSMKFKDIELKKIKDAGEIPVAIHGTYYKVWDIIRKEGLKPMRRTHIHFAQGLPDKKGVISGMKKNSQIYIYLNIPKCLEEGIELFVSENGVVLSAGKEGVIEPKYFEIVVDRNGKKLMS